MKKIKVKAVKGLRVMNPKHGRELDKNGESVELNLYWKRRIKDKEVEIIPEVAVRPKKQAKKINKNIDKKSEE